MPSRRVLKAFDNYANILQRLETLPLQWNKKKQNFEYISSHKKLLIWYFFMLCETFVAGCCLYIVLKELSGKKTIPLWELFLHTLVGACAALGCFIGVLLLQCGNMLISGWKTMIDMESYVRGSTKHRPPRRFVLWEKLLILLPAAVLSYSTVGSIFVILMQLDPFHYVFQDAFPASLMKQFIPWLTIAVLRYLLTAICLYVFFRNSAFLVLSIFALVPTIFHCLEIVTQPDSSVRVILECFARTSVQYNELAVYVESGAALCLAVIIFLGMCGSYSSIMLYDKLPMPLYLACPSILIAFVLAIQLVFVPITNVFEKQIQVQRDLKLRPLKQSVVFRKYMIKKCRIFHPIGCGVGLNGHRFFVLKKSSKSRCFDVWATNTINVMLSVPV